MLDNILSDTAKFIIQNEGCTQCAYLDTEGHPTVGIGFNLDRADAEDKIEDLGYEYDLVRSGQMALSPYAILSLFNDDVGEAEKTARAVIPHFTQMRRNRKKAFTDMAFNLGHVRLLGFKKMIAALEVWDMETAAKEAQDSKWFHQVGRRGPIVVDLIRRG